MKILVLTIVVFTLNVYVTSATSLDPTQNVEIEDAKSESDDVRTKRSGDIFSSLLKKKFGLLSSLTGSSSGKSIGHSEHYEEPLSYNTKSFNLWGVKKAIMGSVMQAAKAITGGVIALKGQLIKANGHVVVAKGKLMQTKGEAISNFGKTIATHAFDSHQEPQLDTHSVGLYNHLPVTPIHQPTSYGAATALGYQAQAYPNTGFQSHAFPTHGFPQNSYPATAQSYSTGFAVPSPGYGGAGTGYGAYGIHGLAAKRAVQQVASDTSNLANSNSKNLVDKDSVQAGLLIFKPIKMNQNLFNGNGGGGGGGVTSQGAVGGQQTYNQLKFKLPNGNGFNGGDFKGNGFNGGDFKGAGFNGGDFKDSAAALGGGAGFPSGFPSAFPGFQGAANGFLNQQQPGGYPLFRGYPAAGYSQNGVGYPAAAAAQVAYQQFSNGGESFESFPGAARPAYGLQNFAFPQPADSHEFDQQLAAFAGQAPTYPSQEVVNTGGGASYGGDQHDSASDSEEHVAQPSYKSARLAEVPPKRGDPATAAAAAEHFLPTTVRYSDNRANKRSAAKKDDAAAAAPQAGGVVPLKSHHDGSSAEDQDRLKKTVQRFFSMLQKRP